MSVFEQFFLTNFEQISAPPPPPATYPKNICSQFFVIFDELCNVKVPNFKDIWTVEPVNIINFIILSDLFLSRYAYTCFYHRFLGLELTIRANEVIIVYEPR